MQLAQRDSRCDWSAGFSPGINCSPATAVKESPFLKGNMEPAGLGVRFGIHTMHPGMAGSFLGGQTGHRGHSAAKAGLDALKSATLKLGSIL